MTKDDKRYFYHQMKRNHFQSLSSEVDSLTIFNMLIKKELISPRKVDVISEAFFRMKRLKLVSILKGENENKPENVLGRDRKTTVPNIRYQQPPKRASSEQTLSSSKMERQSYTNKNVHVERRSSNLIQRSDTDQPLTDQFILNFCSNELGPHELMHLGVKGFKLPMVAIQRAQYDYKLTAEACIAVFTQWKNSAPLPVSTSWIRDGTMPPCTMRGLANALLECGLNNSHRKYFM